MSEDKVQDENLEREFRKYVEIANGLPPQTADNMLVAYGYFKQATVGNVNAERPQESSNVIQTFKYDAWKRLEGMARKTAMRKYIQTIKSLQQDQ